MKQNNSWLFLIFVSRMKKFLINLWFLRVFCCLSLSLKGSNFLLFLWLVVSLRVFFFGSLILNPWSKITFRCGLENEYPTSHNFIGQLQKFYCNWYFRLTHQSTRASHQDLEYCSRSRELEVSLEDGFLPCLVIVRRVLANLDSTSSLRSTTQIWLALNLQPSTRPWFILLVQHLLN